MGAAIEASTIKMAEHDRKKSESKSKDMMD
jgi:hypothetical protein